MKWINSEDILDRIRKKLIAIKILNGMTSKNQSVTWTLEMKETQSRANAINQKQRSIFFCEWIFFLMVNALYWSREAIIQIPKNPICAIFCQELSNLNSNEPLLDPHSWNNIKGDSLNKIEIIIVMMTGVKTPMINCDQFTHLTVLSILNPMIGKRIISKYPW